MLAELTGNRRAGNARPYKSLATKGGIPMPTPNDRGPRRPRTNTSYHMEGDWAVPDREQAAPPPQRRTPRRSSAGPPPAAAENCAADAAALPLRGRCAVSLCCPVSSRRCCPRAPRVSRDPRRHGGAEQHPAGGPVPYGGAGGEQRRGPGIELGHRRPAAPDGGRRLHLHGTAAKIRPPCRSSAGWIPAGLRTPHFWAIR